MSLKYAFLVLVVFVGSSSAAAQYCTPYGRSCIDNNYSCCGGCCLNGTCKDAYLDCRRHNSAEDLCLTRECPDDQVCVTYQPPGCVGCGALAYCGVAPIPDELKHNKTLTHYHLFNSCGFFELQFWIFGLVLVVPWI